MKELKNIIKWVDALESAKYKQGKGQLGDEKTGFCCLGLGCYILGINYNPCDAVNDDFAESVGLLFPMGLLIKQKTFSGKYSLIKINDRTDVGFKRIAELIKTHPDWLFNPKVVEAVKKYYNKTT